MIKEKKNVYKTCEGKNSWNQMNIAVCKYLTWLWSWVLQISVHSLRIYANTKLQVERYLGDHLIHPALPFCCRDKVLSNQVTNVFKSFYVKIVVFPVWSLQHQHVGVSQKCRLFGPIPDLLNQKLEMEPINLCFIHASGWS